MGFSTDSCKFIQGVNSYGDFNELHRRIAAARRKGLSRLVVPGMWGVSHFQGGDGVKMRRANFNFRDVILAGDVVETYKVVNGSDSVDYFGMVDGKKVFDGSVFFGDGYVNGRQSMPTDAKILSSPGDIYQITRGNIDSFKASIGYSGDNDFPEFYFMAFSAPALNRVGKDAGIKDGFHLRQSIEMYGPYQEGSLEMGVVMTKNGRRAKKFDLYWSQNGEVVAKGSSTVGILSQAV